MTARRELSCVLVGSETLLVQCAEILRQRGHGIRAVVTRNAAIAGWARPLGLTVVERPADLEAALAGAPFDLLFSIANLELLPDALLRLPREGGINFHDGPLPEYAGLYTPMWALLAGATQYGVTWHAMEGGVDEGDVLAQQRFEVSPGETSLSLNAKCMEAGIESFARLVEVLEQGPAPRTPQDLSRRRYYGKFERPAAACALDFSRPAEELERLVRALDFGPYENPIGVAKLWHGGQVFAVRAVETLPDAHGAPGTVLSLDDAGMVVATASGALALRKLATLRGADLPAAEVARRLGVGVGSVLELSAERAARLTALVESLVRSEAAWARELVHLQPIDLPYLRAAQSGAPRGHALDVPGALAARGPQAVIAAFALWLARLAGKAEVHVSAQDADLAALVGADSGLVATRVPLRLAVDRAGSVRALEEHVRARLDAARKRKSYLHDLVARVPSLRADAALREDSALPIGVEIGDPAAPVALPHGVRLALCVSPDGARARIGFDSGALDADGLDAVTAQLAAVFAQAAAEPERAVARVSLLGDAERRHLLHDWNATARSYRGDAPLAQLFAEQVARTPDAPAVSFEGETLSYRELDARANQLAARLRSLGVGPDRLVGVHVERSLALVTSVLAVLKAGGAYVPLDPAYPRDRVAFMVEDSGAAVILTQDRLAGELPRGGAELVRVDTDWDRIARESEQDVPTGAKPENLAYVIYTSGSTGKPKGVMVEQRNVANFFAAMDEKIPHDPPGTWLAVTSLSFDISVLELLWTLTRGFHVVVYADRQRAAASASATSWRPIDFGLFLWGSDDGVGPDKYRLMLEAAKFGDRNGFTSISTPERHFHAFGGPYPNPSVTSAAIAAVTSRIQIRAGSCVLPLHHPIRVAEEWAVVDHLSNGRVAISFAAGWQPNDFVIRKEGFADAKRRMFADIDVVRRLWRGEAVEFDNPLGQKVPIRSLPRPLQPELPTWVTTAGNTETYRMAGACGAHLLTHLLGQTLEEVGEKIHAYRRARADAGLDPATGKVTLMLHTFVGDSDESVREIVREPMKQYLASSVSLIKGFAWAFPAFKRPKGATQPDDVDLEALAPEELDAILEHAFERYFETSGLFGTPERCAKVVERVKAAGVDEIACLIDYGVATDTVLASLEMLEQVRAAANARPHDAEPVGADHSFAAQVSRHGVTHLQCTPSMARMLATHAEMRSALGRVRELYVGGEAFPTALARDLAAASRCRITNMYGPTETTIWSSTQVVDPAADTIPIGKPIANTQLYVVDEALEPVPVGVAGELLIGGDGVVRGYHRRPELTAERFVPDPFSSRPGARLYRTGDLARWRSDGTVEFLGRMDHQVKLRGYRIELGEIEAALGRHEGVRECVVVAREDVPGDPRLVAYLVANGKPPVAEELKALLRQTLPEFMVPATFVAVERFPQTPNGKVDRKALPAPDERATRPRGAPKPPANALERSIGEIWRAVLGIEDVGADDNFFDLGGHSLLVVQVHRRLRESIAPNVSLTDLYRFPTIRSLAESLGSEKQSKVLERSIDRGAARRESMLRRQQVRDRARRGSDGTGGGA